MRDPVYRCVAGICFCNVAHHLIDIEEVPSRLRSKISSEGIVFASER